MSAVGYVVKTMGVRIGATEYQCAVRGVTETENSETVTTRTACPDGVKQDTGPSSWSVTIDYNVSNLPGSLHRLLRDSAGTEATLIVEPFPVEEPGTTIEYDVILRPGGGQYVVGSYGEASVTLPVIGTPYTDNPV